MSLDKHKQIYDSLKHMAREHKIEILIPQARTVSAHAVENDMHTMNKYNNILDKMLAISLNNSINSGNIIIKNRKHCEITEYIKEKNDIGLEIYLKNIYEQEKDIESRKSIYKYKFINNFAYLIKENPQQYTTFAHILENSKLFKAVIENKDNLFIKVAFEVDDYNFLRKKVTLENILQYENLQDIIYNAKTNTILEQLLKEPKFIDYLENNFNIMNFVDNNFFNVQKYENCFKGIISSINLKHKIDFKEVYQQYTKNNENINKESLEFKLFNARIKTMILYSNYDFNKEDANVEVLSEENQHLINKKLLNTTLHTNLIAKKAEKLKLNKI